MNLVLWPFSKNAAVMLAVNHPVGVGTSSSMGSLETVYVLWLGTLDFNTLISTLDQGTT